MLRELATEIHSLGTEPKEVLGFESEKDLELALIGLMQEMVETEKTMVAL